MADAVTFIAGVSGVLQAVQAWYASRSHAEARSAFDRAFSLARSSPEVAEEASAISRVVPQKVFDDLAERAQRCWTKYEEVLNGDYLPAEVDEATEAVKQCICRELRRLISLGEPLPRGKLAQWWVAYCRPAAQ